MSASTAPCISAVDRIASFTDREREIIVLVVRGLKDEQIASRLSTSKGAISYCLTSIFDKLGVSDRLELIIYGYCYGLTKQPSSRATG